MHFDALTLAGMTEELNEHLAGGRVQQVVLPDAHAVGLEVYACRRRHYLLLAAHASHPRVHRVGYRLRRGVEGETPLLLLLRKYVRGAVLERAHLPFPYERVLFLAFDHPEHGTTTLVAELIGRAANLLLLDPGHRILDALRRVPGRDGRGRVLGPRHPYTPPPAQDRLPPMDDGSPGYRERLQDALDSPESLWRVLVARFAGVSPTLAREVAWRATEGHPETSAQAVKPAAVASALRELWSLPLSRSWSPGLGLDAAGAVVAFAPYRIHFLSHFQATSDISQAVETFYATPGQGRQAAGDPYAALRRTVADGIRQARERAERRLRALLQDAPEPDEPQRLRTQAEWLLALSSQVKPGQRELVVPLEEGELRIPLSDRLSPVEQAQRLFARASKLERAQSFIPRRRAELEADLAFLDQLETDLALAEDQPAIAAVQAELREAGFLRPYPGARRAARPRPSPLRFLSPEGFTLLVGRNARENERVTFQMAHPQDLWLHVRDAPGAHVIVRSGGRPVGEPTLRLAAQLAAYFSRLRGERAVAVALTERRFVTRRRGGHPGQVHYRQERTLVVPGEWPPELEPAAEHRKP